MSEALPKTIEQGAAQLGVVVDHDQSERLSQLLMSVLKVNNRINIIGPCSLEQAVERHLLDSLGLLRLVDRTQGLKSWIDIGTGGGFPGLVWAIMRPDLDLLLVDSVGKKAALARKHAIDFGLTNVKVLPSRFEQIPSPVGATGMVSRATFAPAEWISRAKTFLTSGGAIVATMGGNADPALVEEASVVDRLKLMPSGLDRTNLLFEVA